MKSTLTSAFLISSAFAAAGCAAPVGEPLDGDAEGSSQSALVKIQGGDSCVTLLAGQTIVAGTVCSSIEGENLRVTYATTGGWSLHETHLWAGLNLATMPQTNSGNPKIGNFPFASGPLAGTTSYSVTIPLATFGLSSAMTQCDPRTAYIVSHAVVKRPRADGTLESQSAYGEGTRLVAKGNWATWFSVVLECADDQPPVVGSCETAFARSATHSSCFIGSPSLSTNRWGWTNGPIGPGSYSFPIYAGAGKCDIGKGTLVGSLAVTYNGASANVSYSMASGFTLDETHLYIGSEPFPRDPNGSFTVAPGQYGNIHDLTAASSDSFTVSGLSGSVYVIAHASTCSTSWPE